MTRRNTDQERPLEMAGTVVQLMRQIERRPAGSAAVESSGRKITIGELRELSNRLANAFTGLGLGPGARVAYAARNHAEYVVLEFALLKAGLVKVPLNHRLTPAELMRCMDLADVKLVVADMVTAAALDDVLPGGETGSRMRPGTMRSMWSLSSRCSRQDWLRFPSTTA